MDDSLNEKANSRSQQRLLGMVYAYKKGKLDLDDLNDGLAEKIKTIADGSRRKTGDKRKFTKGMSTDDALDFASTKHKGLPQKVEENKTINMKKVMTFDEFINEAKNVDKRDKSVIKLVDEINELIKLAIDEDGDAIGVIDTTSTWESPTVYKPIVYSESGNLTITNSYPMDAKKKDEMEVIKFSNVEEDGIPTLKLIKKMYTKAVKNKTTNKYNNLEVELAAAVNPDDYQRKTVRPEIKSKKVKVSSIDDAVEKCREFIDKNHLGGGNWDGGNLYSNDKLIGYISYNGRVWDKEGTGKKELKY